MNRQEIDGVLVQWGERLFYPANRVVRSPPTPRLDPSVRREGAVIRQRIAATVRHAPQVMVRIAGSGRGMAAIAAHFRYITRNGRLAVEDDREVVRTGKDAVRDLLDQWRYGGARIGDISHCREAHNLVLSMPAGTNAELLMKAVREFAHVELAGHRYVMVLHEDQANPHVHLCVKADSGSKRRLHPSLSDLFRWRVTFAEKLRGWGVEAEASRPTARGEKRRHEPLWRIKDRKRGELRAQAAPVKRAPPPSHCTTDAMICWAHILKALAASDDPGDRELAERVRGFVRESTAFKASSRRRLGPEVAVIRQPTKVQPTVEPPNGMDRKLER